MNKIEIEQLANDLLETYNLKDWSFGFNSSIRSIAKCKHFRKQIFFSKHYIDIDDTKIKEAILHEIAHALVGYSYGHKKIWKEKMVSLGCVPTRCFGIQGFTHIEKKYQAICTNCGFVYKRYRRRQNVSCGVCDDKYNELYKLEFIEI